MDVNKPSLWKSGAGGGRVMRERVLMVVVVVGGEGWVSECVCGGLLLLSFSLSYVRPHTERHLD